MDRNYVFIYCIYSILPFIMIISVLNNLKFLKRILITGIILIISWTISHLFYMCTYAFIEENIFLLMFLITIFVYIFWVYVFSLVLAKSINDNQGRFCKENLHKIFKPAKKCVMFFILIVLISITIILNGFFKAQNLKYISEEDKKGISELLGIEEDDSLKLIFIEYDGSDIGFYELKFTLSKSDYINNNLDYSEVEYDSPIIDGKYYNKIDENTYLLTLKASREHIDGDDYKTLAKINVIAKEVDRKIDFGTLIFQVIIISLYVIKLKFKKEI